ncbi:MAG: ABC transporter ATP-binding protein [Thermoplasmatales archaeon]|nr:MAG: ABC transporter ATP-binding protein [Thermoplasmatales archaeon]
MEYNPVDFGKLSKKKNGPKKSKPITPSTKSTKKKIKKSILEVNDLVAGYGKSIILHGIHFNLYKRELVAVIGPNGAGKSTLLKSIFGLARIFDGEIKYNSKIITGQRSHNLVKAGLTYVPQLENIFPSLTIEENLKMGAFIRDDDKIKKDMDNVYMMFPDLLERVKDKARNLSGGQRQFLAIGRALMTNPTVLLLDEPSAGLSPKARDEVLKKISSLKNKGYSVILVEQNAKKSLEIADRGYILAMGRNVFEGTSKDILENEEIGRMFLGRR